METKYLILVILFNRLTKTAFNPRVNEAEKSLWSKTEALECAWFMGKNEEKNGKTLNVSLLWQKLLKRQQTVTRL